MIYSPLNKLQNSKFISILVKLSLVSFLSLVLISNNSFAAQHCSAFNPDTNGVVDGCTTGGADIALTTAIRDPLLFAFGVKARNEFKSSCNAHDRCYYEIGTSKASCDNRFNSDMASICKRKHPKQWEKITKVVNKVPIKAMRCIRSVKLPCLLSPTSCAATCLARGLVTVGFDMVPGIIREIVNKPPTAAELLSPVTTWNPLKSVESVYCETWRQAYYGGVKQDPLGISRKGYRDSQFTAIDYAQNNLGLESTCAPAANNTTDIRNYVTPVANANIFSTRLLGNISTITSTDKWLIAKNLLTAYLKHGPTANELSRYAGLRFWDFLIVPQVGAVEVCYPSISQIPPVTPPTVNIHRWPTNGTMQVCVTAGTGDPNWVYPYINSLYNNGTVTR